jgi:hypothetical protein
MASMPLFEYVFLGTGVDAGSLLGFLVPGVQGASAAWSLSWPLLPAAASALGTIGASSGASSGVAMAGADQEPATKNISA